MSTIDEKKEVKILYKLMNIDPSYNNLDSESIDSEPLSPGTKFFRDASSGKLDINEIFQDDKKRKNNLKDDQGDSPDTFNIYNEDNEFTIILDKIKETFEELLEINIFKDLPFAVFKTIDNVLKVNREDILTKCFKKDIRWKLFDDCIISNVTTDMLARYLEDPKDFEFRRFKNLIKTCRIQFELIKLRYY
ncbi:MAG: hypothetical protein GY756_27815 [bacterium]|nr:hypothetical protein [bacterium]